MGVGCKGKGRREFAGDGRSRGQQSVGVKMTPSKSDINCICEDLGTPENT